MSLHFLPYFWRWLISTGSKIYICKNTVNGTVCSISLIRSSHTPPVDIIKGNSWMWESLSPARNLQLWVWSVRRTFSWKKFKQKKKTDSVQQRWDLHTSRLQMFVWVTTDSKGLCYSWWGWSLDICLCSWRCLTDRKRIKSVSATVWT